MFQAKTGFLDRVEQSFLIFKEHIVSLSLPLLIFQCIFLVMIPLIFGIGFTQLFPLAEVIPQDENMTLNISTSIAITFGIALSGILILIYLILMIVMQLGVFQSIKQALSGNKPTPKENILQYGLQNLGASFKTYWYIFAYVALIPAVLFIIGGVLFILSQLYLSQDILRSIAIAIMGISVLIFVAFAFYRGILSTFSLMYAVDMHSFTKENFQTSLQMTKGKWWYITWNVVLVSIIGGLALSLINNLAGSIGFLGKDFSSLMQVPQNGSRDYLATLEQFTQFNIFSFIGSTLKTVFSTLFSVYLSVFLYVMMRSLKETSVPTEVLPLVTSEKEL